MDLGFQSVRRCPLPVINSSSHAGMSKLEKAEQAVHGRAR